MDAATRSLLDLPPPRRRLLEHPLFHLTLLVATFFTTTYFGGRIFRADAGSSFWGGLPFSVPLLLILGVHEMGHYLTCRRYGLAATLPYFLPAPIPTLIGTFGALIRIKEPIRDKRALLDVGAAGPLAGFAAAVPFLLYGVTRAQPISGESPPGTILFHYPLAVRLAQALTATAPYTSASVRESPVFMAAWFGLLVTALNLLPIGQLDGGHVLRAVAGRRQPVISYAVLAGALATALRGPTWAFFGLFAALFIGVRHPPVENEAEPLDPRRLGIALLCLIVFLLCFTPVPIEFD
ncbi:MAG TPA: site-2 protease family protein [Thermoanaerobaculia bacterium]|nr:site-2 protease family protein [Thermoanaerobaculia bacterium]